MAAVRSENSENHVQISNGNYFKKPDLESDNSQSRIAGEFKGWQLWSGLVAATWSEAIGFARGGQEVDVCDKR
jgi:hypothetical protein